MPPFVASLVLATIVGLVSAVVATFVGRAIPKSNRSGTVVLLALLPLFVPGMSMGAALFIFLRSFLGFKLGFWSMFLGHLVWAMPFSLLIVLVLTTRFDHRLVEAAADLGASKWRTFWDIEFPDPAPGDHRRRPLRVPAFLQRDAPLDLPARHRDDDADLELDHGLVAAVAGADHLLAGDDHARRRAAVAGGRVLAALRQDGQELISRARRAGRRRRPPSDAASRSGRPSRCRR